MGQHLARDVPGNAEDGPIDAKACFLCTAGREAPFRIGGVNHGGRKGLILLDQVRAVDKTRLAKKLGAVSSRTLTATLRTLQEVFAE